MISIERAGNGFGMKFSWPGTKFRAYRATARNVDEVKLAIDHHLGTGAGHTNGATPGCPLCREVSVGRYVEQKDTKEGRRR